MLESQLIGDAESIRKILHSKFSTGKTYTLLANFLSYLSLSTFGQTQGGRAENLGHSWTARVSPCDSVRCNYSVDLLSWGTEKSIKGIRDSNFVTFTCHDFLDVVRINMFKGNVVVRHLRLMRNMASTAPVVIKCERWEVSDRFETVWGLDWISVQCRAYDRLCSLVSIWRPSRGNRSIWEECCYLYSNDCRIS